jgi:hypothetical protein
MPTFRIETLERWPRRVVYELEATCIEAAIARVRSHSAEPVDDKHLLNEPDQIIEISSVEHIDEPKPSPSLPAEPPKPAPFASAELQPYTVLLRVPGQFQERAGKVETFLAHLLAFTVAGAIEEAQVRASVQRGQEDLADQFEPLLVIEGHHEELVIP